MNTIPWSLITVAVLSFVSAVAAFLAASPDWKPPVVAGALAAGCTAVLAILTYHGPAAVSRALGGPKE